MVMTSEQSRRNRRAGAGFESALEQYFRDHAFDVMRLPKQGRKDRGDLVLRDVGEWLVIEAKNEKVIDLSGYLRELDVEKANFDQVKTVDMPVNGVVIVKRRNHGIGKAYVVTTVDDYFGIKS